MTVGMPAAFAFFTDSRPLSCSGASTMPLTRSAMKLSTMSTCSFRSSSFSGPFQAISRSSSRAALTAPRTVFQNSCVVPFGMTASFSLPDAALSPHPLARAASVIPRKPRRSMRALSRGDARRVNRAVCEKAVTGDRPHRTLPRCTLGGRSQSCSRSAVLRAPRSQTTRRSPIPPIPEHRITYDNTTGFRGNPIGIEEQYTLSYKARLYGSDSKALRENYFAVNLAPQHSRLPSAGSAAASRSAR